MAKRRLGVLDRIAIALGLISVLDRALKLGLIARCFSQRLPDEPRRWPSVTILQPVTRGSVALHDNLEARAALDYPGRVQHILVCDAADEASQAICREVARAHPELELRLIRVDGRGPWPAPKLEKLHAGMPHATGDVLCLMDDDVAPRRDNLRRLVVCLRQPGVGASFGLPCYTDWETLWSSLLSAYVNAYTLEDFITWSCLSGPLRVVGQMACYRRRPLAAIGGFSCLENYLDDDFVLAQRLRRSGLRPFQAPVVFDVYDGAASWREYGAKFTRWIVLPKQAMAPFLTTRQRLVAFLATPATILLPSLLGVLALITRRRAPLASFAGSLGAFALAQTVLYVHYLRRRMSPRRWPLLAHAALVAPVQATLALLAGDEIEWRGQRLRVFRDGHFERVA
jgi:ceramide glucosyltransferase